MHKKVVKARLNDLVSKWINEMEKFISSKESFNSNQDKISLIYSGKVMNKELKIGNYIKEDSII